MPHHAPRSTLHVSPPSEILPGVIRWSAYSPLHKVELASHAVWDGARCLLFDPIPLPEGAEPLERRPQQIVLTNENHPRAAAWWSEHYGIDVWAAPDANLDLPQVRRWGAGDDGFEGWSRIALPGGAGGETAFHLASQSLVVFGDAVVNLAGRGLEILPDRYCQDPLQLRASLRHLPPFQRAVFAHGEPILQEAAARIAALL